MKILITNDDGIEADGIVRLAKAAKEFGEVWVVAPESQRSAASHSISLHSAIDIFPYQDFIIPGVHAYSCSGTPGDCVRVGSLSVMPEKPDVVLSGINFGFNVASDIQYSATAGAAFEAAFQGYHAIALSEGCHNHSVTDKYIREILKKLLNEKLPEGCIHNVNFPDCDLADCKGVLYDRKVSVGMFYKDHYNVIEELENGGLRYMVEGVYTPEAEAGTDFAAILDNYVSVGVVNNVGY
ncbi:5'-nucleotidase /3'-nucleotidase /exopolyphosphatase [Pseudobutyrivibrio sp. YE44]|uniref:5'/3'-nucleotidase SurE n=1 Tax=Pseudobutyrivibrio sp. YE44 TaxID=1520802 RepID=UPI00088EC19E|nr:5'/3'-nucleotidase SurE [Pseudobutyrivibrio sp. YE44]SDB12561.1 5'-nucleotidase /3'-nucleotidase /exopolyphosphatase [Pseudobutyrivibrio sp. YE44]